MDLETCLCFKGTEEEDQQRNRTGREEGDSNSSEDLQE